MSHSIRALALAGVLSVLAAVPAFAQAPEWAPPGREMPMMPRASDLRGDWLGPRSGWFEGVDRVSGVRISGLTAAGEPRRGSDVLQIARFMNGPVPAVTWSDRNGDDRADLIEIFKSGGVIIQLIDANYDSQADVKRVYDASGKLLSETRM